MPDQPAPSQHNGWFWLNLLSLLVLVPLGTILFQRHLNLYVTGIILVGGVFTAWALVRLLWVIVEKATKFDLRAVHSLSEIRIFNRGDCCAERARTLQVLLSTDGESFVTVYRHDGSVFNGAPLIVPLGGRTARFVRLQLGETNWFHLDEVEVYGQ